MANKSISQLDKVNLPWGDAFCKNIRMKKIVIIGGGPAGASCALWLHQLGCDVQLIEKYSQAGGLQNASPYVNAWFPSVQGLQGQEIARNFHEHLLDSGVSLRTNTTVRRVHFQEKSLAVDFSDDERVLAHYLVIATGAKFRTGGFTASERLAIGPGRNFEALDLANKRVAILGGGDNAFDAHRFAMERGAAHAQIFARSLRAQSVTMNRVPKTCVSLGTFEADERVMKVNGQSFDCISVQYGYEAVVPDGLDKLERTASGYVLADHWGATSLPNVYAIGEVTNTFHPATVTSMAHGIQAAKHIYVDMTA
jgi:thioredoxin reductase